MNITEIVIETRGKNRDYYGNPYNAYRATISFENAHAKAIIYQNVEYGNCREENILSKAIQDINHIFGVHILINDKRIRQTHTKVKDIKQLENPEKWKFKN